MTMQEPGDARMGEHTQISFLPILQPTAAIGGHRYEYSIGDGSGQQEEFTTTMLSTETALMTTTAIAWATLPATTVFVQESLSSVTPIISSTFAQQMQPTQYPPPFPPPPYFPPKDQNQKHSNKLSDTAEDLIIAFTSIGGTLLFLFSIYAFYQTRRGVPFNELLNFRNARRWRKSPKQHPHVRLDSPTRPDEARTWDAQNTFATATTEKVGLGIGLQRPRMVMIRAFSNGSTGVDDSQDVRHEKSGVSITQRPLYDETSGPPMNPVTNTSNWPLHSDRNSRASSPVIPPAGPTSQSESRNTRNGTITTSNSEPFPNPNAYVAGPLKKPPAIGQDISRFSWSENMSQEPPTPRFTLERQSVATSRSSLARFRKIDSWVNNQTGRINSALFHNQPPNPPVPEDGTTSWKSQDTTVYAPQPRQLAQPKIWKSVLKENDEASEDRESLVVPTQQQMLGQEPVNGGHGRHESNATVFRHHPGTMVPAPRASVIKSEDLDRRIQASKEI